MIKLMIIDKNMNSVEVEVNETIYRLLNIKVESIKKHEKKRDLNITITEFLESFNDEK